jgi:DNA-3-methyladenine glycosylase I
MAKPSAGKTLRRCAWAGDGSLAYIEYHDREWGVPAWDDRTQFEFLILEGAQAGLSWSTILNKREGYRAAFAGFDPEKVARFTAKKTEKILRDPGIVRNRLKVSAAVTNARLFLRVQEEFDGFCNYIWRFVDGQPKQNRFRKIGEVPASSTESDSLSKDLKQRGFKFVGTTIMYAHMQATGMVNDHLLSCFRHAECAALARKGRRGRAVRSGRKAAAR